MGRLRWVGHYSDRPVIASLAKSDMWVNRTAYGCAYPVCTYEPISQSNDWPCNVHNGSEDSPVILYVRRTVVVVQTARYSRSTGTHSRHFPVRECTTTYMYSVLCAQWFHVHDGSDHLYWSYVRVHVRALVHTVRTEEL